MALGELGCPNIIAFVPSAGNAMESDCWKSPSVDELWELHRQMTDALNDQFAAQQAAFEGRLRKVELQPQWLSAQFRSAKKRRGF
jgi:hypothetical protein